MLKWDILSLKALHLCSHKNGCKGEITLWITTITGSGGAGTSIVKGQGSSGPHYHLGRFLTMLWFYPRNLCRWLPPINHILGPFALVAPPKMPHGKGALQPLWPPATVSLTTLEGAPCCTFEPNIALHLNDTPCLKCNHTSAQKN